MADQAESGSGAPGSTEDVGGAPPHAGYISGAPAAAQQPTEPDTGPALEIQNIDRPPSSAGSDRSGRSATRRKLKPFPAAPTPPASVSGDAVSGAPAAAEGGVIEAAADGGTMEVEEAAGPTQAAKLRAQLAEQLNLDEQQKAQLDGIDLPSLLVMVGGEEKQERPSSASRAKLGFSAMAKSIAPFVQGAVARATRSEPILPATIPELDVYDVSAQAVGRSAFPQSMRKTLSQTRVQISQKTALDFSRSTSSLSKAGDTPTHEDLETESFMTLWSELRAKEIKGLITDELRRLYITLTVDDEECRQLNVLLSSLTDVKEGSGQGVCQMIKERLPGHFLEIPEQSLPGAVDTADSSDTPTDTPTEESERYGMLMRWRFEDLLETVMRTATRNRAGYGDGNGRACVQALVQGETPIKKAKEPRQDLFNVKSFCDKFGDLDRWARQKAATEAPGISKIVYALRSLVRGPGEEISPGGLALILGAPCDPPAADQQSEAEAAGSGEWRGLIETGEEFLQFCTEDGKSDAADISYLSRTDACHWLRNVLLAKVRGDGRNDKPLLEIHEQFLASPFKHDWLVTEASPSVVLDSHHINLYALFPHWHSMKTLPVQDFISKWLIGFIRMPLINDGAAWIRALDRANRPSLKVSVGDVHVRVQGISEAQHALLYGQCQAKLLPMLGTDSENAGDSHADLLDVVQVQCAYHKTDDTETSRSDLKGSGVGQFQAMLTCDGEVYLDTEMLTRAAYKNTTDTSTRLQLGEGAGMMKRIKAFENEIIVQMASGLRHILCLTTEGRIISFSNKKQMWHTVMINNSPQLPLNAKVVQVACGANHSLALVDNGLVYGFGNNSHGQLGLPEDVSDVLDVSEPTVLLRFERMSSAPRIDRTGKSVRPDYETVATEVPWVVSVSCGDKHSMLLTASGHLFGCGDNTSGQIGYGALPEHDMVDAPSDDSIDMGVLKDYNEQPVQQFTAPILLEGGHVPITTAQVACGSMHTSVLSHTGRLYVYGGSAKMPCPGPEGGGVKVWRTVHEADTVDMDAAAADDPNAKAVRTNLVYEGGQFKILSLACSGNLTLASLFDRSELSAHHSPSSLNFSTFWWKTNDKVPYVTETREHEPKQGVSPWIANLRFQRENTSGQPVKGLAGLAQKNPDTDGNERAKAMHDLSRSVQMIFRLYVACRSANPAVREEALSLWASKEKLSFGVDALGGANSTNTSFGRIVKDVLDEIEQNSVDPHSKRQLLVGSQLILYRATQKRSTVSPEDVEILLSSGLNGLWRPHLLHDQLWNGLESVSLLSPGQMSAGPFILLEDDVLSKKLEMAGAVVYSESKIISHGIKQLAPRADVALLYLTRRANVVQPSDSTISQILSKEYVIEVQTGKGPGAGTDSNVFIEIIGTHASSGEKNLIFSETNANAFESGAKDLFTLNCPNLGQIKKVVVRNEGSSLRAKWKLDEIRIWQVGNEQLIYDFQHYGWMDARIPSDHMRAELWYDPNERFRYEYEIKVNTADEMFAGTNSRVFIILHGLKGSSKRQRLEQKQNGSTSRLFLQGTSSTFRVPVASDLGPLTKIVVGTTSWGPAASWDLESLEVTRYTKGPSVVRRNKDGVWNLEFESVDDHSKEQGWVAEPGESWKFQNKPRKVIGDDKKSRQIELYPDANAVSSGGRVDPPVMSPPDGTYAKEVDVKIVGERDSEILLSVLYVSEKGEAAKKIVKNWLEDESKKPSKDHEIVELKKDDGSELTPDAKAQPSETVQPGQEQDGAEQKEPDSESAQPGPMAVDGPAPAFLDKKEVGDFLVLPPEFYREGQSSGVSYKMKPNCTLHLTTRGPSGGTLYVRARKVKEVMDSKEESKEVVRTYNLTTDRPISIYTVYVFTGDFPEASTSANVSIILKGALGETTAQDLNSSSVFMNGGAPNAPVSKDNAEVSDSEELVKIRPGSAARARAKERTKEILAMAKSSGKRQVKSVGLFQSNSQACFQFEAEDVGEVDEVLIWHDNRQLTPFSDPEWYLHRVEVKKESQAKPNAGSDEAELQDARAVSRIFLCRKWLTAKDAVLGTHALLKYTDYKAAEVLVRTYDFAIVLRKDHLETPDEKGPPALPFNYIALVGERESRGRRFRLPPLDDMDIHDLGDSLMYSFKTDMGAYFGTLFSAFLLADSEAGVVPVNAFVGMRLMAKCYERSAYNTVHFTPSSMDDSVALTVLSACSAPIFKETRVMKGLSVTSRQVANEPIAGITSGHGQEAAGRLVTARSTVREKVRRKRSHKQHKESLRTVLNALETWANIVNSEDFDEETTLQEMVPACARLTLVSVAKHGALALRHLEMLQFVFETSQFPIELPREIQAHENLVIMHSVISQFDRWRPVEGNSFELEEIDISNCFAWNLLYWQCASNPPDPDAIRFVIDHAGFERIAEGNSRCDVKGVEADFALLLHFLVLRQMAKYDVLEAEQVQSAAQARKAAESVKNQGIPLQGRLARKVNIALRTAIFPALFLPAVVHILLNEIIFSFFVSLWVSLKDQSMFSRFEDKGLLQPTHEDVVRQAHMWRTVCSGNFEWLRRRQPITREERLRADQHASVIGGQWQEALAEMRRRWWGNSMLPALIKVTRNMRRWFQIGTTKGSAERRREKSRACHNREQVLEELCRFAPVHTHREYFAVNCFLRQGFKHLIILIVLVFCIFQMLGTWWTLDSGKSLAADLRQIIVDNDFDAEHNTFRHIDRWEDWWNFAYGSIVPLLTAQQMYNGVSYRGELHVSPVLLRQVRAEANSKGVLPVWGPGSQTDMEEKLPLEMTMCAESEGAEDVRDGCAWSKPPHSNLISAWTYGLQFRKYPASGYIVQLDKDNVTATLQRLQQGGWFDAATRFVSMEAMVYSESRDRMAYVNLAAEVSESGWTKPVVRVLSFMPSDFTFWHWLFMVVFVAILGNEAITILDIGPRRYFTSFGHCANLVQAGSIFAIFICQMSIISQTSSFKVEENVDPWVEKGQLFNIDYSLITFVQVQRVCASISILLSMLKFIGHFRNLPIAGPIVLGILELLRQPVIIWFLVCYSWLLLGFAMCFYVLSTDVTDDSSFSQVYMSFATMVRAGLSGDMEFGSYTAMDTLFGPMVFVVFIVLSQVIMTNLFIAIVADEYSVAKASGERIWKNNIALLMAQDLISSLPVDSSGQIDMLSQAMLVGHDVRTEPGAVSEDART